jgi:hypothetical protein
LKNHGNHSSRQATDVIRVLQEAVETDYWWRRSILGDYHRFSLLPIAGEFRAEVSISYIQVVLVQSLIFGLIIECLVSYFLLRFFQKIPTKNPILKSEILSFIALVIALIVLLVAASRTSDPLQVFLIGAMLNVPRFLIPGIVVGYLYKRLNGLGVAKK